MTTPLSTHDSVKSDYRALWAGWNSSEDMASAIEHHRESRKPFLHFLKQMLVTFPAGAVVAELGCGTAIDLNLLAQEFPNLLFIASDLTVEALAIASKVADRFNRKTPGIASDMRALPFRDKSIDLVFTQGVMEHFDDPMPLFQEQIRVLKPGGLLVVNVPQKYTGYTFYKHRCMHKGTWKLGKETEFSYGELKAMGRCLGLVQTGVMGYAYWPSRAEPVFVVRDLMNKFYRALSIPEQGKAGGPKRFYDRLWGYLEVHFGHWFMQNIAVAFRRVLQ